jgi:hypothetical protein
MHICIIIDTYKFLASVILKQTNVYFNISFNLNKSTQHCNIMPSFTL